MSELLNQIQGQWAFALGLVVAFPLLLVALSDCVRPRTGGSSRGRAGTVRSNVGGSSRRPRALFPLVVLLPAASSWSGSPRRSAGQS